MSYDRDGNDEEAYKFYYRHAFLFLNKVEKHPEARQAQHAVAVRKLKLVVDANLERMEQLRPRIKARHDEWTQLLEKKRKKQAAMRREWEDAGDEDRKRLLRRPDQGDLVDQVARLNTADSRTMHLPPPTSSTSSSSTLAYFPQNTHALRPGEGDEFAVRLAEQEFRGPESSRTSTTLPRRTSSSSQTRHHYTFVADDSGDDDMSTAIRNVGQRRGVDTATGRPESRHNSQTSIAPNTATKTTSNRPRSSSNRAAGMHYPSVPRQSDMSITQTWLNLQKQHQKQQPPTPLKTLSNNNNRNGHHYHYQISEPPPPPRPPKNRIEILSEGPPR